MGIVCDNGSLITGSTLTAAACFFAMATSNAAKDIAIVKNAAAILIPFYSVITRTFWLIGTAAYPKPSRISLALMWYGYNIINANIPVIITLFTRLDQIGIDPRLQDNPLHKFA
jgi:hypothetical protein